MKVLIAAILPNYHIGGSENFNRLLAELLIKNGDEVIEYSCSKFKEKNTIEKVPGCKYVFTKH
jgi:hypothetical protein